MLQLICMQDWLPYQCGNDGCCQLIHLGWCTLLTVAYVYCLGDYVIITVAFSFSVPWFNRSCGWQFPWFCDVGFSKGSWLTSITCVDDILHQLLTLSTDDFCFNSRLLRSLRLWLTFAIVSVDSFCYCMEKYAALEWCRNVYGPPSCITWFTHSVLMHFYRCTFWTF